MIWKTEKKKSKNIRIRSNEQGAQAPLPHVRWSWEGRWTAYAREPLPHGYVYRDTSRDARGLRRPHGLDHSNGGDRRSARGRDSVGQHRLCLIESVEVAVLRTLVVFHSEDHFSKGPAKLLADHIRQHTGMATHNKKDRAFDMCKEQCSDNIEATTNEAPRCPCPKCARP